MRSVRRNSTALLAAAVLLCAARMVHADAKASMARVDQEIRITIGPGGVEIQYDTVLNRPAAFLEVIRMDADQDGKMSPDEQARYFTSLGETLAGGLELSINGVLTLLEPQGQPKLTMPFTKTYRFKVPHPDNWSDGAEIELHNDNYLALPGTVTIILDPGEATDITHQHIVGQAIGDSGRADLAEAQQRDIVFRYRKGTGKQAPNAEQQTASQKQTAGPRRADNRVWIMILAGIGAILAAAFIGPRKHPIIAALTLLIAGGALYASRPQKAYIVPDDARAAEIFVDLHQGIYRAFNARTENEIYDTLAMSLQGDLLDRVYNEVRQTASKRTNQQMSFRIRRVKAISTKIGPAPGAAFTVK